MLFADGGSVTATDFLYGVVLVYATTVEGGYATPSFSEDITVVRAASEEAARRMAEALGREAEVEYGNAFGERVAWRFLGVAALQLLQVDDLEVGATLLSQSFDSLERYRDLFEIGELPEG
ncbi:DUF4288 domain-containing protein [Nonomuraea rhodomycinica]|uniref:DUF4288 domain-containing protein n=1 Tax=Nonomuraea rhodomycinica TaxID=1712872 RepID=A0A7Y6MBA8_9ACTN|nr:DUF4288 domain-containing protein [Nonomuraea rhodomycinica]NUW42123.1 DUF4288 domain-containing protein [Nonomuraea rhodomycinica]